MRTWYCNPNVSYTSGPGCETAEVTEVLYHIGTTEEFGRGLYASRDIEPSETICQCEILALTTLDTETVNSTSLQFYTFKLTDNQDCLVLGDGEIFNHSDNANVSYELVDYSGEFDGHNTRQVMVFKALNRIETGSQLFIDYSADVTDTDIDGYKNQRSLIK